MTPTAGPYTIMVAKNGDCGIHAPGTAVVAEFFVDIRRANENARDEALANACLYTAALDLRDLAREYKRAVERSAALFLQEGDEEGHRKEVETAARIGAVIARAEGDVPADQTGRTAS